MSWRSAIIKTLRDSGRPMRYTDIAQAIIDKGYRVNVGATPATTVGSTLADSLGSGANIFVKVDRGIYALAEMNVSSDDYDFDGAEPDDGTARASREMGFINAFGIHWNRHLVDWGPATPQLLGVQQSGSSRIDFAEQAGVYVLYDGSRAIYVGRAYDLRLGRRLREHTRDRLTGRWDRFSWFGVRAVREDGRLGPIPTGGIAVTRLIATMEALLIEGLEPPQNRRQGDGFSAVEFIQESGIEIVPR